MAVGLIVGKTVGIAGAVGAGRAAAARPAPRRAHVARQLLGVATIAGIGFTVSLFITGLAFDRPDLQNAARLAVLVTSVVAAGLGSAILLVRRHDPRPATD